MIKKSPNKLKDDTSIISNFSDAEIYLCVAQSV